MITKPFSQEMHAGGPDKVVFWTDFAEKDWPLTTNEPVTASGPWIGTALASGTTAFTDAVGGAVILSGAATTDNSGSQIQHDLGLWAAQASKNMALYVRLKPSVATDIRFLAGICTTDTTAMDGADGFAALTGVNTDVLGFFKPDDVTTAYLVALSAGVVVLQHAIGAVAAATWYELEFVFTADETAGSGKFQIWVNRVLVGETRTNSLPTTTLAAILACVSGSASGTISTTIDAFGIAMDR